MTPYALDHPLVREYLRRLEEATAALPPDDRDEIRDSIRTHLLEALAQARNDADILNALDRLGEPHDIVEPTALPVTAARRGTLEIAAVVLLLVGGVIVPVVGWVAGVVLLWASKAWTVRDKVLGTLVFPGGLALLVMLPLLTSMWPFSLIQTCTEVSANATVCGADSPPPWLVATTAVLLLGAPVVTAVHLLRAAGRPDHSEQ